MSLIGRPSSPPFALISSAQICLDIRWALPEEASPPVSDTPKPILIGSCACAEKNAPDNAIAAAATTSSDIRGRAFSAILILYPFIASSPGASIEPTQRAFDANDTSDLLSARKQDARWDSARRCNGPRAAWAPHYRTISFAFSPACSAVAASDRSLGWHPDPQHDHYRASPYH